MRLSCVRNVQQTTIAAAYLMFDFINTNTDTLPPFLSLSQWSHNPKHTHRYRVYLHLYFSCCWDISPWRALTCNRCAPHCAHNCSTGRVDGEGRGSGNIHDLRRRIVYELHPQSIKLILFDTLRTAAVQYIDHILLQYHIQTEIIAARLWSISFANVANLWREQGAGREGESCFMWQQREMNWG